MKNLLHQLIRTLCRRKHVKMPCRRPCLGLEELEGRLTPASLSVDGGGAAILTAGAGETNNFTLLLNPATDRYEFSDTRNAITFSGAGSGAAFADCQNADVHTVTARNSFITSITLQTGINSDTVTVKSTAAPTTVNSLGGNDTFNITPSARATIDVNGSLGQTAAGTSLIVDKTVTSYPFLTITNSATGFQGSYTFDDHAPVNFQGIGTVPDSVDLTVTMTDNQTTAEPGNQVTYTIAVTNTGGLGIAGATLTDNFPPALTNVTYISSATFGAGGNTAHGTGNISDTVALPNFPVLGLITYTVTATIDPAATGILTNTVSVTPPGGVTDVKPGDNTATVENTLTTVAKQQIIALANSRNFFVDSQGLFDNWLGGGEKWLRGNLNAYGNPWYFVDPSGLLFEWNGLPLTSGPLPAQGSNLLTDLGRNGWQNPELLVAASTLTASNPAQVQAADQARGFYRSSKGNFYLNFLGGQEKWIEGKISAKSSANQGNPWYFILPDGSVQEWSGAGLHGTLVTSITPDVNLYKDPSLLFDAFQDSTVTSGGFDKQRHFFFDDSMNAARNLWENFDGKDEKWFRGDTNQFGNTWYFLLPSGDLSEWDGSAAAAGNVLANLGPNAWNDFERVVADFAPSFTPQQIQTLTGFDRSLGLFRAPGDGNFFYNAFGYQEKWLQGYVHQYGTSWYILKPDNTILEWNGTSDPSAFVTSPPYALLLDLPPEVYQDPLLLADAFAHGSLFDSPIRLNPFAPNNGGPGDHL